MINKLKLFTGSVLVASFILSPVLSFANDKDQNGEKKVSTKTEIKINKEDRREDEGEKNCLQIFAHLVGGKDWKSENNISLQNCWMPFGIAKKWNGSNATTTDITSPIISNIVVSPRMEKARVTWKTNEKTSSEIFFSTSTPVSVAGTTNTKAEWFNRKNKEHSFVISKLSPNTTYHLIIRSKDKSGNVAVSNEVTFTTLPKPLDTTAPVISAVATVKATSTIQVGWKTNEPSKSLVYYGTINPIDINATGTARIIDNSLLKNHILTIPNLSSGTTYYIVVEAGDESNNKRMTDQFNITTL